MNILKGDNFLQQEWATTLQNYNKFDRKEYRSSDSKKLRQSGEGSLNFFCDGSHG